MAMTLTALVSMALIVAAMLALGARTTSARATVGPTTDRKADRTLDAVRQRYLCGEIDRDEYEWRVLELLTS